MKSSVRAFLFATMLLSLGQSVFAQQVAKTIPNSTSPDGLIGFLEFRPKDYGTQKHPLIIFLHGIGERGNGTSQINYVTNNAIPRFCAAGATMSFTVNGQTSSFVVLSPQLSAQYGYWPTFYVKEMIKYAKANLQIDPNRIYITGLSLGGGGTWRVITDTENFDHTFDAGIAAAAPVCGTQEESDADFCTTIGTNHLPIWAFHSMDDGTVPVGCTQHAEILGNMCGNTPAMKLTYYQSGGHVGAWLNAYDTGHITTTVNGGGSFTANPNLYEWLLSNVRTGQTGGTGGSTTAASVPPTVNAGSAQTVTLPTSSCTLSGSATGNNGASISSYSWAKTSGPSSGSISAAASASTSVTGLVQGSYVFTLTATDNKGLSSSATVPVTVNAAAVAAGNQTPVADAGANATITLPTNSVTLNGGASKDPDGSIVSYQWTQTAGPAGANLANRNAASTTVSNLSAGNYTFILEVTDNGGLKAYAGVYVTVNAATTAAAGNQTPVANAGSNVTVTLPTNSTTLNGSASKDPDGSIVAYQWTQTAGPAGATMANRNAATTALSNLSAGSYTFVLEVTDNGGLKAYSGVYITVNGTTTTTGNQTPVANAGSNATVTLPTSTVTLNGTASKDPDGTIVNYQWTMTAGPSGSTITSRNAATTTVTGLTAGSYTFILEVTDNGGLKAYSAVYVTVSGSTAAAGNLLGYIKMSTGPYQACADNSSSGRIAVYGSSIANGSYLYTDAAMTQAYNGGWNWFSFTPTLGGAVTQAFAIYPVGSILLLTPCASSARVAASATDSTLKTASTVQSAAITATPDAALTAGKTLNIYPNPVTTSATIELNSVDSGLKTVSLYNSNGVLAAKYNWQTVKGVNTFSLKNVSGLSNGLYVAEVRDSNGKQVGSIKFMKM